MEDVLRIACYDGDVSKVQALLAAAVVEHKARERLRLARSAGERVIAQSLLDKLVAARGRARLVDINAADKYGLTPVRAFGGASRLR